MPLDTNLSVLNSDLILQSKLETMSNLNKVFDITPVVNTSNYSTNPVENFTKKTNLTVRDALTHPDWNIRNEAIKLHEQDLLNQDSYYGSGLGVVVSTPWEQAEKYSGKKYGFDIRNNNEQKYYEEYLKDFEDGIPFNGSIKNVGRFLGRTIVPAATKFVEGVGYLGSMLNPINWDNNYWENVADNALSNLMLDWEKDFKNSDWFDVYKGLDYDRKGFFEKLGDATFWTDEFADGVAFLASAFIPSTAASKLGWLGKAGEAGSLISGTSRATKAANLGLKTITGSDTWGEVGLWAFNTANESAFEAAHAFKENFKEFKERRDKGEQGFIGKSDEELRQLAGQKSANIFKGNLAVLGLSTAWEQRNIFKPLLGRNVTRTTKSAISEIESDLSAKIVGGLKAPTTKLGKVLDWGQFYGKRAIGGLMAEGYWEENAQLAIERMNSADRTFDYTNPEDNSLFRFLDQITTQAYKAGTGEDEEAATSIGLGGLIGMFGMGVRGLTDLKGTERLSRFNIDPILQREVDTINQARKNFLNIPSLMNDKGQLDPQKVKIARDEISKIIQQTVGSEEIGNDKFRDFLQDNAFANYITAAINANKFESVVSRLQELSTKTPEQLAQLGLDATNIKKTSAQLVSLAQEVKKVKDTIENQDIKSEGSTDMSIRKRKELATEYTNQSIAARNLKEAFVDKSSQSLDAISKLATPTPTEIREINVLTRIAKEIGELIKDEQVPNFIKEQKKRELKEIQEKIKSLEETYSKFEDKPYKKNAEGYYFSDDNGENFYIDEFTKFESSNRINNSIEQDKLFAAQQLLDKQNGEKALSDILDIVRKQQEKTKQKVEKSNKIKSNVAKQVGNVVVEEDENPTTDKEFKNKLNEALKNTHLTVKINNSNKDGIYELLLKANSKGARTVIANKTREGLIQSIVTELQKEESYKEVFEDIESLPLDKQQDLSPEEASKYIADETALLDVGGEGMKKESEVLPFTDSAPRFDERFEKSELEQLHRKEYLFYNFVKKIGRFAKEKVKLKAVPLTNINIAAVAAKFGVTEQELQFLISEDEKYKFTSNSENKNAVVTYIFIEEKDGDIFLLDKEGERTTDLSKIVISKHVDRNVESLKAKGENNPIRKGADEKRIQSIMDVITNFYSNLKDFISFDFEISRGIRNVPTEIVQTKEGFSISISQYIPKTTIGNVIEEKEIGKTAFIHVQTNTIRTTTGETIIAGRPYLKTLEDNNTGTPIERYEYLDNRMFTEEEKTAIKKAVRDVIEEYKKTGKINKQTDTYRYLQGTILRNRNLTISVNDKGKFEIGLFTKIEGNNYNKLFFSQSSKEEEWNKILSIVDEKIEQSYHRVDNNLLIEKGDTEFLDISANKTYPSYHHYLLDKVLTIRLEDTTKNKPDGEPVFNRIQRYSIIDMSSIETVKNLGVKKEDLINRVAKEKEPIKKRRVVKKPDIKISYSEKKSESPVNESAKKISSDDPIAKAIAEINQQKTEPSKNLNVELKEGESLEGIEAARRAIQQIHQERNREMLEKKDEKKSSPENEISKKTEPATKTWGTKPINTEDEAVARKEPILKTPTPPVKKTVDGIKSTVNPQERENIIGDSTTNVEQKHIDEANDILGDLNLEDEDDFLKIDDSNWTDQDEVSEWEQKEVLRILNQVELVFSDVDRIFKGKNVWGSTKWSESRKAIVTLYKVARSGTGFHEAFEVVYNFILSHQQQEHLINKFRKRQGTFITFNGITKRYAEASAKEAKEKMADEYADYKFGRPIPQETPEGFFQKLWNFVNAFIQRIVNRNKYSQTSLYNQRTIFEMMNKEVFRNVELKKDTNEYFSIQTGNTFINPIDTEQFMRSANYLMFTILNKKNTNLLTTLEEGGELNLSIYDELRKEIRDYYKNKEQLKQIAVTRIKQVAEILGVDMKSAQGKVTQDLSVILKKIEDITETEEGWRQFVQSHKNYLSKFGISFQEDTDANEEKEGSKTNEYNNDKLKFDNFKSTPAAVKLLISSLEERVYDGTPSGQQVINPITLTPHTISESQYILVFNRIMNFLSGSSSIEQVKQKMDEFLSKERNFNRESDVTDFGFYSIVKQLREKIFLNEDASEFNWNNADKFQIKNLLRFVGAFAKQNPLFVRAKFDENNKVYFTDADFENQIAYTRKNFYRQHQTRGVFTSKPIPTAIFTRSGRKININKKNIPTIPSIGADYNSNLEEFAKALNQLGFNFFTKERLESMLSDERRVIFEEAQAIAAQIEQLKTVESISPKGLGVNGRVNNIARVIAYYTSDDSIPMLFNAEGEAQSKYIDHNTISLLFSDMDLITKIAKDAEERRVMFFERNPNYDNVYFRNSIVFKNFFEKGIVPKTAIYSGLDAYEGSDKGKGASSLTHEELYITRLALSFSQRGRDAMYPIYENADGNIDWQIQPGVQYVETSNLSRGKTLDNILSGYLQDDIEAILEYNKTLIKGRKENHTKKISIVSSNGVVMPKREAGATLGFSSVYLTDEQINFIYSEIEKEYFNITSLIESLNLKNSFLSYIDNKSEEHLYFLKTKGFYDLEKNVIPLFPTDVMEQFDGFAAEDKVKEMLKLKVANDFVAAVENSKLIFGRIQSFKSIDDSLKRFKSFLSPRLTTLDSAELNNWMNQNMNDVSETDLTYHKHSSKTSIRSVADIETFNSTMSQVKSNYTSNNAIDAQSAALASFIREIKFKTGSKWSEKKENMYQVHIAYERWALDKKEIQPYTNQSLKQQDLNLLEPFKRTNEQGDFYVLNLTDLEQFEEDNILKPIITGLDENGHSHLIKTSTIPLTYYLVEGTHMEDVYLDMRRNKDDIFTYTSAHKVGQEVNENGKVGQIVNLDGTINNLSEVSEKVELDKKNTSIQVETEGEKNLTTAGTQAMKIVTTDIYSGGVPLDFQKDNIDRLKIWLSLSEEEKLQQSTLYNLERNHNTALSELFLHHYYNFLESINVKENIENGVTTYISLDNTKLRDKIEEYVTKHGVPKNIIEQLEYDDETGIPIKYELMSDYSLIKSIIYSMIDKGIASPKLNGGQKIQFASMFFDKKSEIPNYNLVWVNKKGETKTNEEVIALSEKDREGFNYRLTNSTLGFYDKIETENEDGTITTSIKRMQVMISSRYLRDTNKKREQLGLSILSEQEFLELLKKESPKILEGIGFRIPTQAINSIDAFEIVGFLPDFMGDAVAVPSELTTKVGSDFDVDKLVTYLNNMYVDSKGIPRYVEYETDTLKLYKRKYEKYETLLNRINNLLDKKYEKEIINSDVKPSIENLFSNIGLETTKQFWSNEEINEILQEEGINQLTIEQLEELVVKEKENRITYEEFSQLPLYRQNSRKAVENRYFQSIADILLHPSTFERLVRPNDASKLEKVAEEMDKLKGRESKDSVFNLGKLTDSLFMTAQRALFQAGKRLVGIGAVGVTSHSNFQKITSVVTSEKEEVITDKGAYTLRNKLIFSHNKVENLPTLSGHQTKDGDDISEIGGAFVDGTVDIVKKPWLLSLGAYGFSYSVAVIANRLGYSKNDLALVINNPLTFEYQRLKEYFRSPAKLLSEDKDIKYARSPKTKGEWIQYFAKELGVDVDTYLSIKSQSFAYSEMNSADKELVKEAIKISHHNIEGDNKKGNFDFAFLNQKLKELPAIEANNIRFAILNAFEDFMNLEKIANDTRAIISSSNHETAHVKDNSVTLSKESNLEFIEKLPLKALIGFDSENKPIFRNTAKEMRDRLFVGVIADKIVNFENNYIYKEILMPQTQQLARWVVKQLSKDEEFEVYNRRAEELIKDFEKSVMSSFLFDSTMDTMTIPIKSAIREVTDYSHPIRQALDKAINIANNSKFDSEKFKKGLTALEILEAVPEDSDDNTNNFYYIKVKKRPTSQDTLGSASLYDGLMNLKYNTELIEGTEYTYADMYNLIMLHSIYRNGVGFSKNSLLSFMSPKSYRAISENITEMEIDPVFLKMQEIVMIQNKPSLLGEKYDYFKGPIIRISIKDGKIEKDNTGKAKSQKYENAKYKNTSAYKVTTGEKTKDEVLEFDDIILLPGIVDYKGDALSKLQGGDKATKIAEMEKEGNFNNRQVKKKFIYYKSGSKKKGNNAEVLLYRTGITVKANGLTYFVYQHFPIKGSKQSREYGSIRSLEDYQSQMRDENVPVYSQSQILNFLSELPKEEDRNTTNTNAIFYSNPSILDETADLDYTSNNVETTPEFKISSDNIQIEDNTQQGAKIIRLVPKSQVSVLQPVSTPTITGIEINSYQTGLGNDLTNVHYATNGKSKFDIIPSNKELTLTKEAKAKWGESVEAWYKSNNAQTKGIPEGEEGDKYDFDLMVGLITDKLTQYPNLIQQINQRGGLEFLQNSTHNMGNGRWSSKNPKNMFMRSLIQAYQNVSTPTVNVSSDVEQIYSQLGNRTQSKNVTFASWSELKQIKNAFIKEGIVSTRIQNTNEHFGNPFSHEPEGKTQGLIKTATVKEAVEKYIDWVINSQDERAKWIREELKSGKHKGKPILYYKELEEPSHATALDYLINKYNWNKSTDTNTISPEETKVTTTSNKKGTFTHKDRTIQTEFELTPSQDAALRRLIDFSTQNEQRLITLQGPAGTGKTSTIGNLQNYLKELGYNVVYMAPTHAATAELAFATAKYGNKEIPLTVQSAFQRRYDPQIGQETFGVTNKLKQRLSLSNNIIVIDETSMLNAKDYDIVKQVVKEQGGMIKVIFMGDPMQIPEVNTANPIEKNVSKAFTEQEQIKLTEIKRTNDMSILNILTKLRDYLSSYIPRIANTERLQYLPEVQFNTELINKFRTDPENTVLISYTNKSVQSYNNQIRNVLGRTGDLQKGDLIVGFLGYQAKQIEKGNIANSVRYTVESVNKNGSEYIITANSSKLKELEKLNMKGVREKASTVYLQLSTQDSLIFEGLTNEDFQKNNRKVADMFKRLYNAKQAALKNPRLWTDYYTIQLGVVSNFESIELGNNYVYNPATDSMEILNNITHKEILKNFPELKVEKGIDFGHAITVHKSQGQTIKNVFFNSSSLPKGDSSKIMMNGEQISSEKQSLIYVGLSRASEKLYILDDGQVFWDFENNQPFGERKEETTYAPNETFTNENFEQTSFSEEEQFIPSEEDEEGLDAIRQDLMKDAEFNGRISPENKPDIDLTDDDCL